jgi:adenosine kinase
MAMKIYGMGNPLLDISAEVGAGFLTKYDLQPANAILAEDKHLPIYKELAGMSTVEYIPGGATLNSIRVAQWMSQTPGTTYYAGCIGSDEFGDKLKSKAEADGVSTLFLVDTTTPTGTCAVCIVGKERSLCANLAAANNFKESHMSTEAVTKAVSASSIFYSAGFFLTVSVPSMLVVAKHAAENNKIFAFNLSAPFLVDFFADQMSEVMPYGDFVFGNETEAAAYGVKHNVPSKDIREIAKHIAALPKLNKARSRTVVFTQGKDPTVVACDGNAEEYAVPHLDASKIVDTNGAGDAFVGGFLSKLAIGADMKTCVAAGNYAASEIIQRSGCTLPDKPTFSG